MFDPTLIGILAAIAIIGCVAVVYVVQTPNRIAAKKVSQSMPAWAAQGPFENGDQSAHALEKALTAAFGEDATKKYADAISGHSLSFDASPETWEETRMTILEEGDLDAIALGKKILVMEAAGDRSLLLDPERLERHNKKISALDDWIDYRKN